MTQGTFDQASDSSAILFTDGGIETRLIYAFGLDLPEFASSLPLFREGERQALETS